PDSKYAMSFSESVDLVSLIACARILSDTYSIQAWFSGVLPYFFMKLAVNAFDPGVFSSWCHTVGHRPPRLSSPAAQASAVFRLKPTTGYGSPNSAYCLTKLVTWLPARLVETTSGRAWRILSMKGLKSVTSVATSSSATTLAPWSA